MDLSEKQKSILTDIKGWYFGRNKQYLTFGGYAGTGKTTLLGYLSSILHQDNKKIKIAFCSYTGKASRVLQRKLKEAKAIDMNDYVGTIHRLIYKPIMDDKDEIIGWSRIEDKDFEYDLIVVDEASMVTKDIWNDLLSFDKPVLAVGDHGQLPPIEGSFNLMEKPELRLEEIFRQEANNPIIKVSEIARRYGTIPAMEFSPKVVKFKKDREDVQEILSEIFETFDNETMVLTGYNSTRVKMNKGIRQLLEFESPEPLTGDRVICLKNNHIDDVFNGMTGTILSIDKVGMTGNKYYEAEIELDGEDEIFYGNLSIDQFGKDTTLAFDRDRQLNLFDFGYALTVHKAQGSQARRVVVFEERFSRMTDDMWKRWLYTAVTRATEELYII